jgi:hypothetical protein
MKKLLILILVLSATFAATITSLDEIQVTDEAQIGIHLQQGLVGELLIVEWSNEKAHIFPSQYVVEFPDQQFTFDIFVDDGACGHTDLIFSTTGATKTTALKLPKCSDLSTEILPTELPVEAEFGDFERKRLS